MNKKLLYPMIRHAYDTVPYYQGRKELTAQSMDEFVYEDFANIPILNKSDVLQNEVRFLSNSYRVDFYTGTLIKQHTSGSTGNCLDVYWSLSDYALSNLSVWKYRSKWYDVKPADKYLTFHTTLYSGNTFIEKPEEIIYKGNNLSFNKMSINDDTIQGFIEHVKTFKPVWMMTQPSVLQLILNLTSKKDLDIFDSIKYIELTGEYLHSGVLRYIQESLPRIRVANMYGAVEIGSIALECPHGKQHVIANNAFVEIISPDGANVQNEEGKVIVTGLKNTAMPFLRYSLGDRAVISDDPCSCGCKSPIIKIMAGREGQNIIFTNGQQMPCYVLLYPIEKINAEFNHSIIQFQVVQHEINRFIVYFELKEEYRNWFATIKQAFLDTIKHYIQHDVSWEFILNDHNHALLSNKLQFFVQNL